MSKRSIPLTLVKSSYPPSEGVVVRGEVMPFEPDVNSVPGVYLQFVDGCGYDVYELTPDEATALGTMLIDIARSSRKSFSKKA